MSDFLGVLTDIAVVLGFALLVCALGDLVNRLLRGKHRLGALHVLAWLPAIGSGVAAWQIPSHPYAWFYSFCMVLAIIYFVAFTFAAVWSWFQKPFYRFQVDSPLAPQALLLRTRGLMRNAPGFVQSVKESFGWRPEASPPFIGTMDGTTFHVRRDIRYRNPFLPLVHGSVMSTPTGARVLITMHLHPVAAAFMVSWLGGVCVAAVGIARNVDIQAGLASTVLLVLAVVLMAGSFYPEALKARRLLEQGIARTA